jgi:ammonia channel protein AmtB
VIHCVGGAVALTACVLVGPRQDQYVMPNGLVSRRKRTSVALQVRGTFFLWMGFIALNAVTASDSIVARAHYVAQARPSTI